MAGQQELQVQQKREVDKGQEATAPMRAFMPNADIFETEDALTLVLEMPGVDRDNIGISVENVCSPSKAKSTSASMKACSRSTASTMSVPTGEAFEFRAGLIKTRSTLRCAME